MIKKNLVYILLLLHLGVIGVCQDLIVKKDSSVIKAKISKVYQENISYTSYYDNSKTELKILKNEVSKIIFKNGMEIVFNPMRNNRTDTTLSYQTKIHRSRKPDTLQIGDYIKFNLQAGAVINNSNCNRQYYSDQPPTKFSGAEYSRDNQTDYTNASFNIGFNFLLGASPYIKHVVGFNYLRSKGEFTYDKYSMNISASNLNSSYYSELNYKTKVDFINIISGLRFKVLKHFHIEPLLGISIPIRVSSIINGTETRKSYGTIAEEKIYKDVKSNEIPQDLFTVSLCPRLSYDFKIKQHKLGVYVSYNLALSYNLPWFMVGVTYYPFKRLR